MRYYEFIVEYRGALDSLAKTYGQRILDKLKIVPERINSGYKGDAEVGDDYETIAVRTLDQLNSEERLAQNLPITSNHSTTEYENLTPEIYNEHKGAIVNRIIDQLADYDPTEKKGYTQYIVKWYLSDNVHAFPRIEDGLSTLKESLYYFQKMKKGLPERYRDIAQYTSAKNFMNSVQYFKEEYGKKEELPIGEYKKIYESEFGTAYWPMDEAAACYLGQGTQWCTAATYSDNYFDHYNEVGGLIIINLNKEVKLARSKTLKVKELYVTKVQAYVRPDEDVRNIWEVEEIRNQQDVEIEPYMLDPTYDGSNDLTKLWHDDKFQEAARKVAEHYRPKDWGME
jgi:hypothetical protein